MPGSVAKSDISKPDAFMTPWQTPTTPGIKAHSNEFAGAAPVIGLAYHSVNN